MSIIIKNVSNSRVSVREREEPPLSLGIKMALAFMVSLAIAFVFLAIANQTAKKEHEHRGPITTTYITHDKDACTNEHHFNSHTGKHR